MVKKVWTWWERLLFRLDAWAERRSITWSEVVDSENKGDLLQIERARRAILNHQYLLYMAQAQVEARAEWLAMLEDQAQLAKEFQDDQDTDPASRIPQQRRTLQVVASHGVNAYPGSP